MALQKSSLRKEKYLVKGYAFKTQTQEGVSEGERGKSEILSTIKIYF